MKIASKKLKSSAMAGLLTVAISMMGGFSTASAQTWTSPVHDRNIEECGRQGAFSGEIMAWLGANIDTILAVHMQVYGACMDLREGLVAENEYSISGRPHIHSKMEQFVDLV